MATANCARSGDCSTITKTNCLAMQLFRDQNKIRKFLNDLMTKKESEDLEFKHASGGFPGSFWDTYSSFANTEGGTIIFGIEEKDDKLYLDVLSNELVEKYKKDFWNNVNNKSTVSCNLLKNNDVEVVKFNGYNIMLFHIPCATREQRPVFRTTNPYNGTCSYSRSFYQPLCTC